MKIGKRDVGHSCPVFVIAELSGNHNGSLERAIEIVRAAAEAGADAVKLQTYTADTMTLDLRTDDFMIPEGGPWGGRSLYDLYDEAHTPWEWHASIFSEARRLGMEVFSTPFDESAVAFLETLDAPAFKVASFELTDDPLLRRVAQTERPVIVSTGMASLDEIDHALAVLRSAGARDIVVLRCTSSYPAPDDEMRLRSIPALAERTGCVIGLSDHSTGILAPVVAVALGAVVIEKHLTLRRADGGVDSHFSLEPAEFAELVAGVRRAEAMLGKPEFGPQGSERSNLSFRRSLYFVADVPAGARIDATHVRAIRPGYGVAPSMLGEVIGRVLRHDVHRGTAVRPEVFE